MNERFTGDQHLIDGTGDGGKAVESMLDELDGESPDKGKPSPLGVALLETLRRLIRPGNARATSQRFIGLCLTLCPDVLGLSQRAAAAQLKLTRASLSKTTLMLAEEMNLGHSRWRKTEGARKNYARAQRLAYQRGRHAAQVHRQNQRKTKRRKPRTD